LFLRPAATTPRVCCGNHDIAAFGTATHEI
jgi:hypothetical protein